MTTVSYGLSSQQMTNLRRLVDLGLITLTGDKPRRNESAEVHRFIEDYIREKSLK